MATLRQQIATNVLTVTRFRELMKKLRENRPNDDLELVKKAYEFSQKNHAGQSRASGEPYLVHPLEVATVLADMKMDPVSIAAGLLHDSVEDTSVTIVEIRQEFGEQVAHIVEGVTKISKIDFSSREEAQAENLRKMMLAMVDDIRVVLIKLADRLHNMRTLEHLDPERQQKIARETLDIYAPIAHRLGMGKIRGELEDLGFKHVDPIGYEQVRVAVESKRKEGEAFMSRVEGVLRDGLKEAGITGRVESRVKRLYSIHKKLQRQRISVDQVYDLFAMRVITNSVQDCYAVLGIIHNLWRPVPGRIKDFIAMPRPNLYQSLHTSVITETGDTFEIQIRTEVGHGCVGAKVNGRMVPLRHKLHSGDIVEILTQPGHKPSRDWLAVVKSSRARNKIKHWLNLHQQERAIEIGKKLIEKEARKYRISLKEIKDQELQRVASDYGLGRPEDLMAGIGYGKYSARQALARLVPAGSEPITEGETPKASSIASVVRRVFGGDNNEIGRARV